MTRYLFTEKQLITMLALMGIKSVFLFAPSEQISASEITAALHELFVLKRIETDGQRLRPTKHFEKIFRMIGDASSVVRVRLPGLDHLIFHNSDSEIVVLEIDSAKQGKTIKLQLWTANGYVEDLLQNERLPQCVEIEKRMQDDLLNSVAGVAMQEYPFVSVGERIDIISGKATRTVSIADTLPFKTIRASGKTDSYYLYSKQTITEQMLALFLEGSS